MIRKVMVGLMAVLVLCSGAVIAQEMDMAPIITVAEDWLKLVDGGQYEESWETSAAFFKTAVKKEDWIQAMSTVRKPFGKVLSRKVKSTKYETALPGAPDGEYVVIQFETSYENKMNSIEAVTPMLDPDGSWRVSGYYIQ